MAVKSAPKYLVKICDRSKLNILDEVQKSTELFDTIKLLMDDGYRFILTGSSVLHLFENVSETLAGRIRIRYLPTCAWGEAENETVDLTIASVIVNQTLKAPDPLLFQNAKSEFPFFMQYGGFPELGGKYPQEKADILRDYRNTYLQRDILELTNIQDLAAFRGLLAALAQSIGRYRKLPAFSQRVRVEPCNDEEVSACSGANFYNIQIKAISIRPG
jgi:predicted AAA+ superfamily ATPase